MIRFIENIKELKNYEEFYNFLSDKEEKPKLIVKGNLVLIILKDFELKENHFDFFSFFILLDKEKEIIYTNLKFLSKDEIEKIKNEEEFIILCFNKLKEKLDKNLDFLNKKFEKILKKEEFELEDLFFISTSVDVLEIIIKENRGVIKKVLEKFNINDIYIIEDFLQLESEISLLNKNVENLILAYSAYYNMKTSKLLDKITIIAFLFIIPSTIFSMYGMNFEYIPFSDYKYGFILVAFLSFFIIVILYLLIKRKFSI